MSYLELLKLAAPEAILVVTTLAVLTIGLVTGRRNVGTIVSVAGRGTAGDTPAATPRRDDQIRTTGRTWQAYCL